MSRKYAKRLRVGNRNARLGRSAGTSLLDVMIGATTFMVAMGAVTTSLVTSRSLVQSNREVAIATDAAQSILAEITTTPFEEVFVTYNEDPTDDLTPDAPGMAFDVSQLTPQPGDLDGRVGRVLMPGDGFLLREDTDEPRLGLPRDLDLDGAVDDQDHADDYRVLPVIVIVEWTGAAGRQSVQLATTLAESVE